MKYIAVIDHDLVDKEFLTVRVQDKEGKLHDIDAKPLVTHTITLEDGQSLYLTQGHIQALLDYEKMVGLKQAVDDISKRWGKLK